MVRRTNFPAGEGKIERNFGRSRGKAVSWGRRSWGLREVSAPFPFSPLPPLLPFESSPLEPPLPLPPLPLHFHKKNKKTTKKVGF